MAHSVYEMSKQRQLSMLEIAERTGLDLPKVRAIFLGRWTPKPDERQRIAAVLSVTPDELAWGHTVPIQHIYGHGPG